MALIDRRFNVRLQNIPRREFLDEEGLYMRTQNNDIYLLYMKPHPVKIQIQKIK
ncbi:hypothetical protein SESBI_15654 [Sesbania bispinosa]|nr:hypothetical protein SESBI_15654 [Sesbania bispinosa]